MIVAQLAKLEQEDMQLREAEAGAGLAELIVGFTPIDTDNDDEDYIETPSSSHFPTATHDHEAGASGDSMSERILSMTEHMFSMQKQIWQFQQEQARKNNTLEELTASLIRS